MNSEEEILSRKGVKITANRVLVLRSLMTAEHPISLSEMEELLPTMDKSSIFRTLNLFLEHHVTHKIEDEGTVKYEICHHQNECDFSDMHTHFHCEICHQTICLHDIYVPIVPLPDGYQIEAINYMIKGICPKCKGKNR